MGRNHVRLLFALPGAELVGIYDPNPALQTCMQDYYAHVDACLGKILEDIPDDAAVIVVSDHGIKRVLGVFRKCEHRAHPF